jgi:predicted GTPase
MTVGHGLESYTTEIRTVRYSHPIDGRPVAFVDTPGFGDTYKSDTEILAMVAEWLVKRSVYYNEWLV